MSTTPQLHRVHTDPGHSGFVKFVSYLDQPTLQLTVFRSSRRTLTKSWDATSLVSSISPVGSNEPADATQDPTPAR